MKKILRFTWMSIICALLISCSSTHFLNIETQQPAKLTFPITRPFVVVVNNAVPQPENTGFVSYQIKLKENTSSTGTPKPSSSSVMDEHLNYRGNLSFDTIATNLELRLNYTDSLLTRSTKVFAKEIQTAAFFYEVSLYETPLRTDKQWMKTQPIPKNEVSDILSAIDADAIISIDKLLFLFEQHLSKLPYDDIKSSTTTISQIACSIYLRDKEKSLSSLTVNDTILNDFFFSQEEADSTLLYQTLPELVLHDAAISIGEKIADYFTPTWNMSQRTVYTSQNARMKEALVFSNKNKWQQAQQIWMELFDSNKDIKSKARLASNIAVAYEMQDNLEASSQWIEKSNSLYGKCNSSKVSEDIERITQYEEELKTRIQNNRLLDLQLGETE